MVGARQRLELNQRLGVALTPAMRQSLALLRMPAADLRQEIARELGENPFLRVARPPQGGTGAFDIALDTIAHRPSLGEGLRRQIGTMPLSPPVRAMAEYLTGELRDDGYLDTTVAEAATLTGQTEALVEEGLAALQACDPAGVGARDLPECLALQLADLGIDRTLAEDAVARLADFAQHRWGRLRQELRLPDAELRRIAALLRLLRPRPVEEAEAAAAPLLPDLAVERTPAGAVTIRLTRQADPGLSLDRALLNRALPDSAGATADPFVAEARGRAEALIRAVRARGATLLRIGEALLAAQHRFFIDGPEHLQPMTRQAMAAELGLHPATLGRAVAGKALSVDGVLHPLSGFFSGALPAAGNGEVSSRVVRLAIRRLVDAESPARPLSDRRICERLRDDGVDISRRTVAKYRSCMRIPPSSERRRRKG